MDIVGVSNKFVFKDETIYLAEKVLEIKKAQNAAELCRCKTCRLNFERVRAEGINEYNRVNDPEPSMDHEERIVMNIAIKKLQEKNGL